MRRFLRWLMYFPIIFTKFPRLCLLFALILIAVLVLGTSRLRITVSPEDMQESSILSLRELKSFQENFRLGAQSVAVLEQNGKLTESEMCALRRWVANEVFQNNSIKSSFGFWDVTKVEFQQASNHIRYPRVFEADCLNPKSRKILPGKLPVNKLVTPYLASNDGTLLVLTIEHRRNFASRKGSLDVDSLRDFQGRFEEQVLLFAPNISKVHWIGSADFEDYLDRGMSRGKWLNLIFATLILVFMRFSFGTWRSGFLYLLSLILTAAIVYGGMGWLGHPIDILSSGLFMILGISALEDFVYVANTQRQFLRSPGRCYLRKVVPCFLTSLTTVVGFGSLCVSDVDSISRFGFWMAAGSLIEWAVVFGVLPALGQVFPALQVWVNPKKGIAAHNAGIATHNDPTKKIKHGFRISKYLFGTPLVFLFPFFLHSRYIVNTDPFEMLPKTHEFKTSIAKVEHKLGWKGQLSVVFDTSKSSQEKAAIAVHLASLPEVIAVDERAHTLRVLAGDLPSDVQRALEQDFSGSQIEKRFLGKNDEERMILFVRSLDFESLERVEAALASVCKQGCRLMGAPVAYRQFAERVRSTLLESLLVSLFLVLIVVVAVQCIYGQKRDVFAQLLGSFWGPAFMASFVAAAAIPINFITCIFAAILVGLAGDNAIQFAYTSGNQSLAKSITQNRASGLMTGLVMALFSLSYLGSYFEPSKMFGVMLFFGFLANAFGDVYVAEFFADLFQKPDFQTPTFQKPEETTL
jgi:uncharacterized protein